MRKLIATICALLVLAFAAAPLTAIADPYVDNAAIDELFEELRVADNEVEADQISRQIWTYWFTPSDTRLATHMSVASLSLAENNVESALTELNIVVTQFPDYAEGWNQRATLHYMMGNFEASLADIEHVLAIEPRHYGALSGRVLIYLRQGKTDLARADMIAALAIHPYLNERRFFPDLAKDVTHV